MNNVRKEGKNGHQNTRSKRRTAKASQIMGEASLTMLGKGVGKNVVVVRNALMAGYQRAKAKPWWLVVVVAGRYDW